ncbi:hypothetical protein ASG41_16670 [Modestobacter sp. Leaf380]|nr:hypothetical protein ASG41_16670 [Modestobacter sp. Leaf380]
MTTTYTRRLASVAGALIAGSLALSACSGGEDTAAGGSAATSIPADATFNTADVTFAQGMVPHHDQAVEMAQMTQTRSTNPQVLDLATRIEAAQGPEIDTLTGWLEDWGSDSGSDSGVGGMSGMMSSEDMASLESLSGVEFDRMWLEMMLEHHTGAVGMAETEIADGEDPAAIAMAEDIQASQSAEITEMEQLLQTLAG